MLKLLLKILDGGFGLLVRRRANVRVGPRTRLRWRRLLGLRSGSLSIGEDSIIAAKISFDSPDGQVVIGDRCYIGPSDIVCHTNVTLGDDVVISWGVTIVDHNSHSLNWGERKDDVVDWRNGKKDWSKVKVAPVRISDRVWIGFNAIILKGVTIGTGAVIGAGAVVTRDVAPYTIVAGNPAAVVRVLDPTDE